MAFDITPHESVFRVVVGSQIVVPQHIKCHTNLEGNRKQLSYFSSLFFILSWRDLESYKEIFNEMQFTYKY